MRLSLRSMVAHKWLVYMTLLVWIIATLMPLKIDAGCVCSEKGDDFCAGCTERKFVRPKHRRTDDKPPLDVEPIGDKCYCTKKLIEPAVVPKALKKKPCGCGTSSSSYEAIFNSGSADSYVHETKYVSKDDSIPADPISVSLAVQAGKAIEVPEAKLAYGFMQKPIDGMPKIYMSSVNEENLYALKKEVITLNKKVATTKKVEDYPDAEEEEENSEDHNDEEDEQPRLTYKQLGYVAEQYKNPEFHEIGSSYSSHSEDSGRTVVSEKVSVDCGYKPGRIATWEKSKHGSFGNCGKKKCQHSY
ncbi:chorion protein a at 7F [Haematobia irritans]|uniref:chorion protein a at 7F n=1 Tax=Haematobia irritans TaxID=7368 RepID=UPI003F503D02